MDPAPKVEPITLSLVFDPETQEISVSGPIHNRMICYAMLKLAEKAIDENHAKQRAKGILVPRNGEHLRGFQRG